MATELSPAGTPQEMQGWMSALSTAPFDYSQFVSMLSPLASNPQTAAMANTILAQVQSDLQGWQQTVQEAAASSTASGGAFDQQVYNKLLQARQAILGRVQSMEQFLTPYLQQQSLQNAQVAEQAREFDIGTKEQGRQFDVSQALKDYAAKQAAALAQQQEQDQMAQVRAQAWMQSMQSLQEPGVTDMFSDKAKAAAEQRYQAGEAKNQGDGSEGGQQVAYAPTRQIMGQPGQGGITQAGTGVSQEGPVIWGDYAKNFGGSFINQQPQSQSQAQPSSSSSGYNLGLDPNWQQAIAPGYPGYQQPQAQPVSQPQGSFFDSSGFGGYGGTGSGSGDVAGIGLVKSPGAGGDMSWFGQGTSGFSSPSSFTGGFAPFGGGMSA